MASVNKWIGIGNLGKDPDVRQTDSGSSVCNFNMACSEKWKDKSGKQQERTEWVRVVTWNGLAEVCGKYLAKGRQVYVEGRLQTRKWQGKDGQDRYTTEVVAKEVLFLGSDSKRWNGDTDGNGTGPNDEPPPHGDVDECPF